MRTGDLIYIKPKQDRKDDEDYIGLIVHQEQVGRGGKGSTILYDVLLTDTNEVVTISDIYFQIWRIE